MVACEYVFYEPVSCSFHNRGICIVASASKNQVGVLGTQSTLLEILHRSGLNLPHVTTTQVILVINQQNWTHTLETIIQRMKDDPEALKKHHELSCSVSRYISSRAKIEPGARYQGRLFLWTLMYSEVHKAVESMLFSSNFGTNIHLPTIVCGVSRSYESCAVNSSWPDIRVHMRGGV